MIAIASPPGRPMPASPAPRRSPSAARDFLAAAEVMGASAPRIVVFHVVPLCLSSVIVRLTLDMAGIILTAAGLGFLGLGAQPPCPNGGR